MLKTLYTALDKQKEDEFSAEISLADTQESLTTVYLTL